jgi:hypothetical protein
MKNQHHLVIVGGTAQGVDMPPRMAARLAEKCAERGKAIVVMNEDDQRKIANSFLRSGL